MSGFHSAKEPALRALLTREGDGKVVDLLVEQVECADLIVLNKKDKCSSEQMEALQAIACHINPTAAVVDAEWGKVPLESVLGAPTGDSWVCKADHEDDLRSAVAAAKQLAKKRKLQTEGLVPADLSRAHGEQGPPAAHGHGGGHGGGHDGHGGGHGGGGHGGGGHEHGEVSKEVGHVHGQGDMQATTTAATKYGITSFVYSRRRPFHPKRLLDVIFQLPVKVDPHTGEFADNWQLPSVSGDAAAAAGGASVPPCSESKAASVMRAVIRSKGFAWVANQVAAHGRARLVLV